MKRVAALDLLRGLAAFSVAIPHYLTLNATDAPVAEVLAVTAVEVFFVLSGFVLAPQILTQVVGQPAENLASFGDYGHWDAEVRRVVVFRIDSIVFGFLLYVAMAKLDGMREAKPSVRWALPIFLVCSMAAAAVTYLATAGNPLSERAFPYVAAAMGASAVALADRAEFLFTKRKRLAAFSRYLGGISYSVYLFHILLIMLLKPKLQNVDLIWQLLAYLSCLVVLSSGFWIYFEKPILAARPKYRARADSERQAGLVSPA
jgi:peptidoglycan/LPS O-acetylase OafA/YrhL